MTNNTNYYVKIQRNSSVGTYGTLYAYIFSSSAYRTAGTPVLATLSVTLHNDNTWEYLYAASTWNGSYTGTTSGNVNNLLIVQ